MRVTVDIAQRTSNVTNEPGCLAISPSAFVFNDEEGRLLNSEKRVKSFFRNDGRLTKTAHSGQRTEYAARRLPTAMSPEPLSSRRTVLDEASRDDLLLTLPL